MAPRFTRWQVNLAAYALTYDGCWSDFYDVDLSGHYLHHTCYVGNDLFSKCIWLKYGDELHLLQSELHLLQSELNLSQSELHLLY